MIIIDCNDDILRSGILRHQEFLGHTPAGSVYKVTPSVVASLRENILYIEVDQALTIFGAAFMFLKKNTTNKKTSIH